jgi:CubicO group peptidase (beta-lactamase class C family)
MDTPNGRDGTIAAVWGVDPGELLDAAVVSGRIPGAVLVAGTGARTLRHVAGWAQRDDIARRPMTADTIFDLASLTKVVATLPCVLLLAANGELGLDDPVRRYLPGFTGAGKDGVTVRQLLAHTSGLPAHRAYHSYLRDPARVRAAALAEPLATSPGSACAYSDIGFIVLGEMCAAIAGRGLDQLARELVFGPLGMTETCYRPSPELADRIASAENEKTGLVHDENAAALGGVAGHAGLFSTAADLVRYAAAWAGPEGQYYGSFGHAFICQTSHLRHQLPPARRGLGWGLRGDRWDNMGDGWPAGGAGHTGFTGTCLSVDPGSGMWLVLLTNAVHFGRGPEHSVVDLRKRVHARVSAALLGSVVQ